VEQFFDWLDELLHHSRELKNFPVTYQDFLNFSGTCCWALHSMRFAQSYSIKTVIYEVKHSTDEGKQSNDKGKRQY